MSATERKRQLLRMIYRLPGKVDTATIENRLKELSFGNRQKYHPKRLATVVSAMLTKHQGWLGSAYLWRLPEKDIEIGMFYDPAESNTERKTNFQILKTKSGNISAAPAQSSTKNEVETPLLHQLNPIFNQRS